MADEVVEEYRSSLDDLTFNSKPLISMLTMLADDHVQYAAEIVQVIEAHIQKAKPAEKLPALYLLDSIIKNISESSYPKLFSQNLVSMFCGVFEKVDEKTRQAMWKLRQTWTDIIPNKRLYALDIRVQMIDPAWPITAQPPEEPISSIHVNPKFLIKQEEVEAKAKKEQEEQEAFMRQQLLAKQQELLKLQQERLELELAEAKARLVSQAKQIESQPSELPSPSTLTTEKAVTTPKVESDDKGSGSPVNIPTIAVQGIVRDPRAGPRDPRLGRGGSTSKSPPKELPPAAAAPQTKPVPSTGNLPPATTGSVTSKDVAATPSESASKPRPSSANLSPPLSGPPHKGTSRDYENPQKGQKEQTEKSSKVPSSRNSSNKRPAPGKTRPADKRDKGDDKQRDQRDEGRNKLSASAKSKSQGSFHGHRRSSRSRSPEVKRNANLPRSRSRSPRRSHQGSSAEKKEVASRPQDPEAHSHEAEKRPRSPEVDEQVVEKNEQGTLPEGDDKLAEPPTKKSKPENSTDSALPDDFRELFGNQDQDYRCLPVSTFPKVPSTPTTPGTPSTGRWAQFKAERPEEFPFQQPRPTIDMPSPSGRFQDVDMRSPPLRRMSSSQQSSDGSPPIPIVTHDQLNINIPPSLMLEQLGDILTEADSRLQAGTLSHEQHQAILRQLGELQKLQKLKLQLRTRSEHIGDEDEQPKHHGDVGFPHILHGKIPDKPEANQEEKQNHFNRESGPPFDRNQRGPLPPPPIPNVHLPRPELSDQDMREQQPRPGQDIPPLMHPPMPPFILGPQIHPRGPQRFYGPAARPQMNRGPINHLTHGQYILPYDTNKYYIPEHDPRWVSLKKDGNQHKLYIDDRAYELPLGCPPRQIMLGGSRMQIAVDTTSRGIKIDGICYYKIGDLPRRVTINGNSCIISYRGPEKKIWIDEQCFEVYTDAAPQPITVNGKDHRINIDSIMNQVIIDEQVVCPFGGPKKSIELGYHKHEIQFEPPPRKILIDNKLCELNFKGTYPCVKTGAVDYGIRFDGPPREIIINDKIWTVEMDLPRKARIISERVHVIAFGGPGHEVIINGQWYEVKFNGLEKIIRLGNNLVKIKLLGPPPEVKILGEVVTDPVKVLELVGDVYIDPSTAIMGKPSHGDIPGQVSDRGHLDISQSEPPHRVGPHIERPLMAGLNLEGPHMDGPQIGGAQMNLPRMDGPMIEGPHMDGPQVGGAQMDIPRMGGPRMEGPHMDSSRIDGAQMGIPRMVGPRDEGHSMAGPRMGGSRMDGHGNKKPVIDGRHMDVRNQMSGPHINAPHKGGFQTEGPRMGGPQMDGRSHRGGHHLDGPSIGRTHRDNSHIEEPFVEGSRMVGPRMEGPGIQPHLLIQRGGMRPQRIADLDRGMPPPMRGSRGGPKGPSQRGVPYREDQGRNSPHYEDEGGHNSLYNADNFGPLQGMDVDHPQLFQRHQDGPRPPFQQVPCQNFAGHRGYRRQLPRMRGGRGPRMGYRDEFYQQGPMGSIPGARQKRMFGPPPHSQPIGPPVGPPQDFNIFRPQEPQDQNFGAIPMQPPIPPPILPTQIDVNELFGKLISSGIIKKAEPQPVAQPPTATEPMSAAHAESKETKPKEPKTLQEGEVQADEAKETKKADSPTTTKKDKLPEVPDLTDFSLEKMKIHHSSVIQRMYGGIQCSSCGVRFITEDMDRYREHLDWHFRQNRRDKDGLKVAKYRQWYYTTNEWIQFEEICDLEERSHSMYFERLLHTQQLPGTGALQVPDTTISCPAATGNADDDVCDMCGEQFENFFDEDTEEWCLRDAIRVGDKTYHPACYDDVKENSVLESQTPEMDAKASDSNPLAFLSNLTIASQPSTASSTEEAPTAPIAAATLPILATSIKTEDTDAEAQGSAAKTELIGSGDIAPVLTTPSGTDEIKKELPSDTPVVVPNEPEEMSKTMSSSTTS